MGILGFLGEWELDGTVGLVFTLLTVSVGLVYLAAAAVGRRRDRRARRWPRRRTARFVGGLVVLLVTLDSGIGASADRRLPVHMVEHMLIWLAVAPMLVGGAPLRLSLFALGPVGRRRLGRALHSGPVRTLTGPFLSTALFSLIVITGYIPAIYDLSLESDLFHVSEHALYLFSAVLLWAPLIGADPIPHRLGPVGRSTCVIACMVPMAAVSLWLLAASTPLYAPYREVLGTIAALQDQRLAGLIMLLTAVPAFALALAAPGRIRPNKHRQNRERTRPLIASR